jgi:hypothetical protein
MNRIGFVIDPAVKTRTSLGGFNTAAHAAATTNLARACATRPFRAYIERGGIFSFNGEKVSETGGLALELISAGAHQMSIAPRTSPQMVCLSAASLFTQNRQQAPKGYRQTIDLIDTIEIKSHLLDEDLHDRLLKDLSWKGNEITNKVSAAGIGIAGAGLLVYTFPMNSLLLRLAASAYIAGGAISWANSAEDSVKYMDLLQSAMRPTFAVMEPDKAPEVVSIIGRIRDTSVKEIYIGSLPDASRRILAQ